MKKSKLIISILIAMIFLSSCNKTSKEKINNKVNSNNAQSNISTDAKVSPSSSASSNGKENNASNTDGGTTKDTSEVTAEKSQFLSNVDIKEVDDKSLPDSISSDVEQILNKRGYYYKKLNGVYYFGVFSGQKPGYKTRISTVMDNNGTASITVSEDKISDSTTQSEKYPHMMVMFTKISEKFTVKTTDGETFDRLHIAR